MHHNRQYLLCVLKRAFTACTGAHPITLRYMHTALLPKIHNCRKLLQAMTHEVDEENDELCKELQKMQFYTLEFLPPLTVKSALPISLFVEIMCKDATDRGLSFELRPGQRKEICSINTRSKILCFSICVYPASSRIDVQLPRKDGFTKEVHVPARSGTHDANAAPDALRMLFCTRISACGQTRVEVFSPVWIMNKSCVSIDVMIPRWQSVGQRAACMAQLEDDIVFCKSLHKAAAGDSSQLQLLGYSGDDLSLNPAFFCLKLVNPQSSGKFERPQTKCCLAGSQSIKIGSSGARETDHNYWKRVSVASIGLKGPLSLQLQLPLDGYIPVTEDEDVETASDRHIREAMDLTRGWSWDSPVRLC
jgi:hypothetical protein